MKKNFKSLTTSEDIINSLQLLGVSPGDTACLHISLSSLGFVPGGPRTVIESVLKTIDGGTLMMPTYSGDLSDPHEWKNPSVSESWIARIIESTPAYCEKKTPTRGMGAVAEYFRSFPGVIRSKHPQSSFSAIGKQAKKIISPHNLDNRFGPESPLGRLYSMNGWVILMGAPWDTVSLFHLTQHSVNWQKKVSKKAPIKKKGLKIWQEYSDIEYPIDWFKGGVSMLIDSGLAKSGFVGKAKTVLFRSKPAVDNILDWRRKEKK